ncbi:MAG: hypothetical protein NC483_05415 [Ruminococcus sp.]|nr:hypothetical protein [Ruminococcus sp.]
MKKMLISILIIILSIFLIHTYNDNHLPKDVIKYLKKTESVMICNYRDEELHQGCKTEYINKIITKKDDINSFISLLSYSKIETEKIISTMQFPAYSIYLLDNNEEILARLVYKPCLKLEIWDYSYYYTNKIYEKIDKFINSK